MKPPGFTTVNPATGQEIEAFAYYDSARTEDALARADQRHSKSSSSSMIVDVTLDLVNSQRST